MRPYISVATGNYHAVKINSAQAKKHSLSLFVIGNRFSYTLQKLHQSTITALKQWQKSSGMKPLPHTIDLHQALYSKCVSTADLCDEIPQIVVSTGLNHAAPHFRTKILCLHLLGFHKVYF